VQCSVGLSEDQLSLLDLSECYADNVSLPSEWVLRRDGNNVKVGSDCYPTSGSWTCPYSGKTITAAGSVDIDHMVPLKNAWIVSYRKGRLR
jgi:hypothetical protein